MVINSPEEDAKRIGMIEKSNYLAHSIRKIEQEIRKKLNKHYRIITHVPLVAKKASIHFFDQCCEIHLPSECEEMKDEQIRLILAHELGHLIFNIKDLKNPEILDNKEATNEEEQYAWAFAYHLIRIKSDEHRSNFRQKNFIYEYSDLKDKFSALVKKKAKPEVYQSLVQSLKL